MNRGHVRIILGILAVPVGLFTVGLVAGAFLPSTHVAANRAVYARTPEEVWSLISDFESYPRWRDEVNEVKRLPDRDGKPVWVERSSNGDLTYQIEEWSPPRRMVTRVADPRLPFGGSWIYEIEPLEGGCALTLTEHGEIHHPVFRLVARLFLGFYGAIDGYQQELGVKLHDRVEIHHLETPPSPG